MNKVCYLAGPMDSVRGLPNDTMGRVTYERNRAAELLRERGFDVFDPMAAWHGGAQSTMPVRVTDHAALDGADCVLALWDREQNTIGTPMEIERALAQHKPVAVVGSHVSPFLVDREEDGLALFPRHNENSAIEWLLGQTEERLDEPVNGVMIGDSGPWPNPDKVKMPVINIENDVPGMKYVGEGSLWMGPLQEQPMTLASLIERVGEWQERKGWLHDGRTFGDDVALLHSEISEMLEEHRAHHAPDEMYWSAEDGLHSQSVEDGKPEGIPSELADLVIRVAGMVNEWNIPLVEALRIKLDYNDTREHRHGGKAL